MNYGAFGKPLQARWVAIEYTMKGHGDAKDVADGWRWLTHAIKHIAQMQRAVANDSSMMLRVAEGVAAMSTSEYPGQGLDARLDQAVNEARSFMDVAIDPDIGDSFAQHIAGDLGLAERGESRHVAQEWTGWCATATAGGARILHKTTKYKSEYVATV
eukprot:4123173-Pyramimonas_sp.AAC.1